MALGLLLLWLGGLVTDSRYVLVFLAITFIYAAFSGGWAIQSGFTGYLNLGYAMFVGLGAYVAANLDSRAGSPIWLNLGVATFVVVLFSLAFGAATLRIRSHYLILATLAAVAAMESTAQIWRTYTRGEDGISGLTLIGSPRASYYWALGFMTASGLLLSWLARSRHGLILHAIRLSEDTARAAGINTVKYRLFVFAVSAAIGGAGGALLVHVLGYAGTHNISLDLSLTVLVYGVVGGATTVLGPMAAAIVLGSAGELLRAYGDYRTIMEALILVAAIRFMPSGAGPAVARMINRFAIGARERAGLRIPALRGPRRSVETPEERVGHDA